MLSNYLVNISGSTVNVHTTTDMPRAIERKKGTEYFIPFPFSNGCIFY
jgi:hypothetical protein